MILFPVVEREMRVAARSSKTYRDRALAVAAFILLAYVILLTAPRGLPPAQIGKVLFTAMGGAATLGALLFGVFMSADSLSSEKREGTLGLLFLTDLKGRDIIIGKFASHGLNAAYQFFGCLPVLAFPILLGGVTWAEYGRMALAIFNATFFSLTAGYYISSLSQRQRQATVGTFIFVGLFAGIIPWIEELSSWRIGPGPDISLVSPFVTMMTTIPGYPWPTRFWPSFWIVHCLGWVWLLLACFILPRRWQEKGQTVREVKLRERLTRWSLGNVVKRASYRFGMLNRNPVCWLDDRYRLQKTSLWAVLLGGAVLWMWNLARYPDDLNDPGMAIFTALVLHYVILIWIAFNAPQRFTDDRRSGAMELMLATPLTLDRIIGGRWLALRRQFGWALLCILVADLFMFGATLILMQSVSWWRNQTVFWCFFCLSGMTMLVVNVLAMGWTALWFSLTSKNSIQATARAVVYVLILHWIYFAIAASLAAWMEHLKIFRFREWHGLTMWFIIGFLNSLFWILYSRGRLHRDFRKIVSEPAPRSLWSRVVGRFFPASS